ncbi:cupin [Chloroflexota bacterium]
MENEFPRRVEKPWGFEMLLAHTPQYAGKLIFIRAGHRLSLQYHEKKDESMYIYAGEALLEIEDNDGQMVQSVAQPGSCYRIPPLAKHRLQAVEDTTIFEISTSELEDIRRLEDDYGRTG